MALLDKFKSKLKQSESKPQPEAKPAEKKISSGEKKPAVAPVRTGLNKKALAQAYYLIKQPYITEKAVEMGEKNKYVFRVDKKANKPEIKKAIKALYGVEPEKVQIVKIQPKKRRLGKYQGWRKGLSKPVKKAIVTLKQGEKIESISQ